MRPMGRKRSESEEVAKIGPATGVESKRCKGGSRNSPGQDGGIATFSTVGLCLDELR